MEIKENLRHNIFLKKMYDSFKDKINKKGDINIPSALKKRKIFSNDNEHYLVLIAPSWDKLDFFGGLLTAFSVFEKLSKKLNYKKKIFVLSGHYNKQYTYKARGIIYEGKDKNIFFVKSSDILPINRNDVYLSTFWTTEIFGLQLLKIQQKYFNLKNRLLLYLIQDFEPGFYAWSSQYYLAENTYKIDNDKILAIFNSKLLFDYFKLNHYRFSHEFFFEPRLNGKLKKNLFKKNIKREKKIIIYGRPGTPRNAFGIIKKALAIWSNKFTNAKEWQVISLGQPFKTIKLSDNKLISKGKVSLEQYSYEMLSSYVGISLMMSPHPSYPPLEMSTFGVKTITNTFCNKDLRGFNNNIISLHNCTPNRIAEKLCEICGNYDPKLSKISVNKDYLYGTSYNIALNKVRDVIVSNVGGKD